MQNLKNKNLILLICLFIFAGFLFMLKFSYAAKAISVDYMPRDQELVTTEKNYATAYNLSESDCGAYIADLNSKIARCNYCLQLKNLCTDCCINMGTPRSTKCAQAVTDANSHPKNFQPIAGDPDARKACTNVSACESNLLTNKPETDPGSTDTTYTNYKTYCTGVDIPGCQKLGCPDLAGWPKHHGSTKCQETVTLPGGFICNDGDIDELDDNGCLPTGTVIPADCNSYAHAPVAVPGPTPDVWNNGLYIITKMDDADCPTGGYTQCWDYRRTNDLNYCLNECQIQTLDQEGTAKALDCCKRDSSICESSPGSIVGLNATRPGYQNNCTNDDACLERINWAECLTDPTDDFCCDNLTPTDCIDLSQEKDGLFDAMVAGTSLGCFGDISKSGDEFSYEFVAKSNEKLMIIWQVQTSPEYFYCGSDDDCTVTQENTAAAMATLPSTGTAPDTYFYTLVKIFDESDGDKEVYPHPYADTIMNQKSFAAAFSVFAAVATGKDDATPAKSIFKQGHKYKVKLYYLIAPLNNYVLRSKISQLQLLVLRIRE